MFRPLYWRSLLYLLVVSLIAACTANDDVLTSTTEQPLIAFEFTPVPTATRPNAANTHGDEGAIAIEAYSVQVDNVIAPTVEIIITTGDSAETALTTQNNEEISLFREREENSSSKRVDLIDHETLVTNIIASRNAVSNLTYTINVAKGVGTLSCAEVITYYEQILTFDQYNVSFDLHLANESYSQSLNVITIGVQNLYDFCKNYLSVSSYNDEIRLREVEPVAIWDQAVQESNAAIRSAENSVGWLKGDPRLLSGVYEQFRLDLENYVNALTIPSLDACVAIRNAYEGIVADSVHLTLYNTTTQLSYNAYRLAVESIDETGIGLYEFCNVNVGGTGQLSENSSQLLPQGLVDTAIVGQTQANAELNMAYYYMETPTTEPPTQQEETQETIQIIETVYAMNTFVMSIKQSSQPNLWEIVIGFELSSGTAPYTLLYDGTLHDNNTFTIKHTCDSDFEGIIEIRDAAGLLFRSNHMSIQRAGVCGL